MEEGKFFIEYVCNLSLKGFELDTRNRVRPVLRIDIQDSKQIETKAHDLGYNATPITRIIENIESYANEYLSYIAIANIVPGCHVELTLKHSQILDLIYLGRLSFVVCSDSANVLHPLDIIYCVSLAFSQNNDCYFRVLRNGLPYPKNDLLYRAEIVGIMADFGNIKGNGKFNLPSKIVESKSMVYAWMIDIYPLRISQRQLTSNTDALFYLDLRNMTYGVNKKYNRRMPIYANLQQILIKMCDVTINGNGLDTLLPGQIELIKDIKEPEPAFHILNKAKVVL